jgi:hypothetical protein
LKSSRKYKPAKGIGIKISKRQNYAKTVAKKLGIKFEIATFEIK